MAIENLEEIDLDALIAKFDSKEEEPEDDIREDDEVNPIDVVKAQKTANEELTAKNAELEAKIASKKAKKQAKESKEEPEMSITDRMIRMENAMLSLAESNTDSSMNRFKKSPQAVILDDKYKDVMNKPVIPGYDETRSQTITSLINAGKDEQAKMYAVDIMKMEGIKVESSQPPIPSGSDQMQRDPKRSKLIADRRKAAEKKLREINPHQR